MTGTWKQTKNEARVCVFVDGYGDLYCRSCYEFMGVAVQDSLDGRHIYDNKPIRCACCGRSI